MFAWTSLKMAKKEFEDLGMGFFLGLSTEHRALGGEDRGDADNLSWMISNAPISFFFLCDGLYVRG